ncbi:SufE family protein [Shewanella sp. GXUN23E]|uniref:SufE family protein n=1 Tax=Shewanella sp. GXUN23E TaxID=3422498 RepID=UPI003D7C82CD
MSPIPAQEDFLFPIDALKDAKDKIQTANNWQEKYRQIMLMGKLLPSLNSQFHTDEAQVRGCESKAWLYHTRLDNRHYFLADSDARIVKGLAALLLAQCQGASGDQLRNFDASAYFQALGLEGQLSPSRTNGLMALVTQMQAAADSDEQDNAGSQ